MSVPDFKAFDSDGGEGVNPQTTSEKRLIEKLRWDAELQAQEPPTWPRSGTHIHCGHLEKVAHITVLRCCRCGEERHKEISINRFEGWEFSDANAPLAPSSQTDA